MFLLILFACPFGLFLVYDYKEYGQTIINNDSLLTLGGSLGAIANGAGRILYGLAFDYLSFKVIFTVLNSSLLICCIGCYFATNGYLYITLVIFTYFSYAAIYPLMATQTTRFLGEKYGPTIFPYIFLAFSIGNTLQFIAHKIAIDEAGNSGFKSLLIVFGVIQLMGVILTLTWKIENMPEEQAKLRKRHDN